MVRDREAQAGSAGVVAACFVAAGEVSQDAGTVLGRDARPVVADVQPDGQVEEPARTTTAGAFQATPSRRPMTLVADPVAFQANWKYPVLARLVAVWIPRGPRTRPAGRNGCRDCTAQAPRAVGPVPVAALAAGSAGGAADFGEGVVLDLDVDGLLVLAVVLLREVAIRREELEVDLKQRPFSTWKTSQSRLPLVRSPVESQVSFWLLQVGFSVV